MEVHYRPHRGPHPENRLHVPIQNHYSYDRYRVPDSYHAASRQGYGMAFRSGLEGGAVVLVELVMFLANLWGGLGGLIFHWDRSYRFVPGMFELG